MSLECKILKSYGLSDVVPFGKYKGWKVKEICSENPQWIIWAEDNVPSFKVSHKAFNLAENNLNEMWSEYVGFSTGWEYWK